MEQTVEQKLRALYELQTIHTQIDKIRQIRGDLPMEVSDVGDEYLFIRVEKLMVFIISGDENISPGTDSLRQQKSSGTAANGHPFYLFIAKSGMPDHGRAEAALYVL